MAFKVKTTAPKLYCVRPNASIVEPGATTKISIILQGFSQPLKKSYVCKDKFLIVSVPCEDIEDAAKVSDIWSDLESKNKEQVVSKKLRVNYVITDEDEEDEDDEEGFTTTAGNEKSQLIDNSIVNNTIVKDDSINNAHDETVTDLQKELDESSAPVNNLSEKLDSNEINDTKEPVNSTSDTTKFDEPASGFSLQLAAIFVIIAFILGWILL